MKFKIPDGQQRRPYLPTTDLFGHHPGPKFIKLFTSVIYKFLYKLKCLSMTSLINQIQCFLGKDRTLPYRGAPSKCITQVNSGLPLKHIAWLDRFARYKHTIAYCEHSYE